MTNDTLGMVHTVELATALTAGWDGSWAAKRHDAVLRLLMNGYRPCTIVRLYMADIWRLRLAPWAWARILTWIRGRDPSQAGSPWLFCGRLGRKWTRSALAHSVRWWLMRLGHTPSPPVSRLRDWAPPESQRVSLEQWLRTTKNRVALGTPLPLKPKNPSPIWE